MTWEIRQGDCLDLLREMPDKFVQTVVTSPPYWGLRDYGTAVWDGGDVECDHLMPVSFKSSTLGASTGGRSEATHQRNIEAQATPYRDKCGKCGAQRIDSQLGLEPTPDEYVQNLVNVFREVRRVLRDDGTVWLNLGDSYNNRAVNRPSSHQGGLGFDSEHLSTSWRDHAANGRARMSINDGVLKEKDLCGIPWSVAFALQADGWYLRSDIIWAKPNPMPESVTDRPTRSHEYIFLLSKRARYYFDADAVREPDQGTDHDHRNVLNGQPSLEPSGGLKSQHGGLRTVEGRNGAGRNIRSVWNIATQPYSEAHFATFPPKLIEPCILAGSSPKACGECGAPWERVTEHGEVTSRGGSSTSARNSHMDVISPLGQDPLKSAYNAGEFVAREKITTGWQPTCDCYEPSGNGEADARAYRPPDTGQSIVLDPFAGSGTTGLVALRHNRSFIGLELNPEYVEMARWRIRDDAPLLNTGIEA